jgi:hypothetical protein
VTSDYFSWIDRHTRPRKAGRRDELDREEPARPAEPIQVQEYNGASTTIIRRIRAAIRDRIRGD